MTNIRATINEVKHLITGIDSRFKNIMESKYNILEHPFYQGIQNLIQNLTTDEVNEAKTTKYHNFYPDPEHKFIIYNY